MATTRKTVLHRNLLISFISIFWLFHSNAVASKPDHLQINEKLKSAKVSKTTLVRGDNLTVILGKAGFSKKDIQKALRKNVLPRKFKIVSGEFYLLLKSPAYTMVQFLDPDFDKGYSFFKIGETVGSYVKNGVFERKLVTVEGTVIGSIYESIRKKTNSKLTPYRFMDAFNLDGTKLKRLQKGDSYSLTYEKLFIEGLHIRDGEIMSATLTSRGKKVAKNFVKFDDGGVFIGRKQSYKDRPLYSPVAYISISSPFNPRRLHPIKRRRQPHWGTDFVLPQGSPVFSAQRGKIIRLGRSRAGGHYVRIKGERFETTYNHLSAVEKKLKVGDFVKAGTAIGKVGCTGYCTKPHLHFQVKKGRRIVDPAKYIKGFPRHYEQKVLSYQKKWAQGNIQTAIR